MAINFDTQTNPNSDTGVLAGNLGTLTFSSTTAVDFSNGVATVKAPQGGVFNNLTITAATGFGFEDIVFNVIPNVTGSGRNKHDDITLTAYNSGGQVGAPITINDFATTGVGNKDFEIVATGGLLTSVMLSSDSGFKQLKQFQVSGYGPLGNGGGVGGVPEASTWAMMMIGFAGLGFAGYRSRRKAGAVA